MTCLLKEKKNRIHNFVVLLLAHAFVTRWFSTKVRTFSPDSFDFPGNNYKSRKTHESLKDCRES